MSFQNHQVPDMDSCTLFNVTSGQWISVPCFGSRTLMESELHHVICEPAIEVTKPTTMHTDTLTSAQSPVGKRSLNKHSIWDTVVSKIKPVMNYFD